MTPRVRRLLLSVVLLGLAGGCAHRPAHESHPAAALAPPAAPPPPVARVTAPGTPFVRAQPAAPFDPLFVVTTQVAYADIFVHALAEAGPAYVAATRLYRGQQAFLLPFARNYGVAPDGRCDLTYELTIRKPDGTLDGDVFSAPLWQGPIGGPGLILYPATSVSFYSEPADPLGVYQIVVRVTDHLSGETREINQSVTLEDYAPPAPPADFAAQAWFNGYYRNPTPELALPALPLLFTRLPADKRAAALPPLLGFYDQLLADNAWLLPAFCARLAAADADEAYVLSLVLGHHLRHASAAPAGVDFATWVRLEDFRTHLWPSDPDAPLAQAAQLDSLWGRFFASGLYAPLERILGSLANHADLGATERWQDAQTAAGRAVDLSGEALVDPSADPALDSVSPPPEVQRDVILRSALWSLRNNARQHPLVRSYLEWTLRVGELPLAQKKLLDRILHPETPAAPSAIKPGAPTAALR